MTDRLDTLLREVIHDLAAEGDLVRPEDRDRRRFALDATDRGYQYRNRRRASLVGVVALVLSLGLGVPYGLDLLRDSAHGFQPAAVATGVTTVGPDGVTTEVFSGTDLPIALVDGWYVLGNKSVLNPAKNIYTKFGGQSVLPSPNGKWVAFPSPSASGTGAYRVMDQSTGVSRRYEVHDVTWDPQWSPDGNTLMFTAPLGGSPIEHRVVFLDPSTGDMRAISILHVGLSCTYCAFTWLPSGQEIALTIAHREEGSENWLPTEIRTYTLAGQPSRQLPIAGFPLGTESWSPDGQLVAVRGRSEDGEELQGQIVEVATGAVVHRMDEYTVQATWLDNDRILIWSGDYVADPPLASVTLTTRGGMPLHRWTLPPEIVNLQTNVTGGGPLASNFDR